MPTMAASTPAMSVTWGRRMKLPMPVNRGAFMASTGRYLGTRQLGLDRLHALLVDDAHHLVAQGGKFRRLQCLEGARPRDLHAERRADPARPAGHDVDDVTQEDGLVDIVRNEQHGLPVPLPEVGEQLLHD